MKQKKNTPTENNNKHIKWFQLLYVGCNNVELVPQIDEQVQIPSKLEHWSCFKPNFNYSDQLNEEFWSKLKNSATHMTMFFVNFCRR